MLIKFLDGTSREIADLRSANLRGADLSGANLYGANLSSADLYGANLSGANLSGADLYCANLYCADLSCADLRSANLRSANLSEADLNGANLRSANLRGADLYGADLRGVIGLTAFCILPAGDIVGYKKLANEQIATLRIPPDAARINAYGSRKCRASYAIVLNGSGTAKHNGTTEYAPGLTVTADSFDPDPRVECSHGIHFFITEQEAKDY